MKLSNVVILLLFLITLPGCNQSNARPFNKVEKRRVIEDISYGSKALQTLDIYLPTVRKNNAPVLVYVHGGAWSMGDKSSAQTHGKFYSDRGIIFISLNYGLSPERKHPAQVSDVALATKWIVNNIGQYGGNRNNLYLAGHSAGAHIVALLATDPQYLNAHHLRADLFNKVIPVDTASFDLTEASRGKERFVNRKINQNFGRSIVRKQEASPMHHVKKNRGNPYYNLSDFLIFISSNRKEGVQQARTFSSAIKQAGGNSELIVVPNKTHKEMALDIAVPDSIISNAILNSIR